MPGGAYDPATNVLYVAVNEEPTVHTLVPIPPDNASGKMTPVIAGKKLYDTNCTLCHGFKNTGNPPYPKLSEIQKGDNEIRKILTEGYGGMPSFGNFSSEEIDNLIAYLRSDDEDPANAALVSSDTSNHIPKWSGTGSGGDWSTTTPQYINKVHHFVDHMGFPAIKPPWGQLIAVDIAEGEILWRVPLGEYPKLVEMGIRNTGTEVFGGPVSDSGQSHLRRRNCR